MQVHQILKSKKSDAVVTIPPEASVSDAAELLRKHRIGSVVVTQDGTTPLGILSERDIVFALAREGASCLEMKVSELMTADPVTCTRSERADDILRQMTEGRFRHMPVVDDKGRMVGLITQGDVVKARLSELSMEKEALEGMIMGL